MTTLPLTLPPLPPTDFTEDHVADLLGRLSSGRSLGASPLAHARFVQQHIHSAGVVPSPAAYDWALKFVIARVVESRLAALRGQEERPAPNGFRQSDLPATGSARVNMELRDRLGAELARIEADFLAYDVHREAWSCLYYRFIHLPPLQAQEIAAIVRPGSPDAGHKIVSRRTKVGFGLLAAALLDRERAVPFVGHGEVQDVTASPSPNGTADSGSAPLPIPPSPSPPIPPPTRWRDAQAALESLRAHIAAGTLPLDLPRDQSLLISQHAPANLEEYRLTRVAAWCRPRYALDQRFVALSLLVDRGEDAAGGRWMTRQRRYDSLADVLADVPDAVLVLLGAPGSGKSTLLRRFELNAAAEAIGTRSSVGENAPVTFFIELGRYADGQHGPDSPKGPDWPEKPDGVPPDPLAWLSNAWFTRYPDLPPLDTLLAEGRVILLLDALNELPHADPADYRRRIERWRAGLIEIAGRHPANRVIVSCRSLDYSAPLSSLELRVPHVRVEPLDDERIRAFLDVHIAADADRIWAHLAETGQLDLLRTPYFLILLVDALAATGAVPGGHAALFTAMVRGALRREVDRANPRFDPGPLVAERDYWRVVQAKPWTTPYALPERGALFPALASLAFGMQRAGIHGENIQVRLAYDDACARLGQPLAEEILGAGEALGMLDDDAGADEVRFVHQLAQEYFAARVLAQAPEAELCRMPWRAAEVQPSLADTLAQLGAGEVLPPLPGTGWEETALMAVAMASDSSEYVGALIPADLVLAGRAAALGEVRGRLAEEQLDALRWALVARSRDPEADLRARIGAALALGPLGDPRLAVRQGPLGEYLMPPMVAVPGGRYTLGDDVPGKYLGEVYDAHVPRHQVELTSFALGQFPVTNAEYARFVSGGGYDDPRWWPTQAAEEWRSGANTTAGRRADMLAIWARFRAAPELIDDMLTNGTMTKLNGEKWHGHILLSREAFADQLREMYPNRRSTAPSLWHLTTDVNPALPIYGICWFEALAYCTWLSAQTGLAFRLPSEPEIEAASRKDNDWVRAAVLPGRSPYRNVNTAHIWKPVPVGVFPEGDTPLGLADTNGNVYTWTSTLWGTEAPKCAWPFPYTAHDGREALDAPAELYRVIRGSYYSDFDDGTPWARFGSPQDMRERVVGLRLARSL